MAEAATAPQGRCVACHQCARIRRLADALRLSEGFPRTPGTRDPGFRAALALTAVSLAGYFNLMIFGYLWHRWKRSRLAIHRADASELIPPGSILLLRHSRDDVMRIPTRNWSLVRLPFLAFEWNYTFEELLTTRLAFVGPLHSLRSGAPSSSFRRGLSWVERVASGRSALGWLLPVVEAIRRRLPQELQPLGASRYEYSDDDWEPAIRNSLPDARMVVVILGAARQKRLASPYLEREMAMIIEEGYLGKTLFVMPPLLFTWRIRARWRRFVGSLPAQYRERKVLRQASRALAVRVLDETIVVITGSDKTEFFYESALDVAGTLDDRTATDVQPFGVPVVAR